MNLKTNKRLFKKILSALMIIFVIGITVIFGIDAYVRIMAKNKIIPAETAAGYNADCILILGAGVWDDGTPCNMLEDRLLRGIEVYSLGASERLLMSGDHGRKNYDEVNSMKQYAIDKNVPSENIFMDHAGFSTYESLYRARDIFKVKKVVIVTQKYHLYRAIYIAEKMGLEVCGVASDQRSYGRQSYFNFREFLARIKDFFYTIAMPEPTYLGDAIPVNGNGNSTNDR